MIVTKNAAVYWRQGTVRNLLVGGFTALSIFSLQSNAMAFHDGKDSYVNGQGVLWQAVKYLPAKPVKIRSEKEDEAAAKGEKKKPMAARKQNRRVAKTIYVMGTFHIPLREIVTLPKEVIAALDRSRVAVFERDGEPMARRGRGVNYFLNDGRTLEMILGAKDFEKLHAIAKKENNFPRAILNWLRPWAVLFSVGGVPRLREEGKTWRPVLDDVLSMEAERRNMVIRALENSSEQLMAFRLWPEKEQIKWVHHFIRNYTPERSTDYLYQNIKLYLKRDLDGLHKLDQEYLFPANTDMEAYRKFHGLFLDWRNANQVERALKIYDEYGGPMFFAVGAAHLPGEKGVVNILKMKGFEIKRLY